MVVYAGGSLETTTLCFIQMQIMTVFETVIDINNGS